MNRHRFKSYPSLACSEFIGWGFDSMGTFARLCNRHPDHPVRLQRRFWLWWR